MEKKHKKSRICNINSELPEDIINVIFSKLSIVDQQACVQVCKAWKNLASTCVDPILFIAFISHSWNRKNLECIELHPKDLGAMRSFASLSLPPSFSSMDFNIDSVNSCRGLLCFFCCSRSLSRTICKTILISILNPLTNEYVELPFTLPWSSNYYYGFGFSPKTRQYKIARHSTSKSGRTTWVEIFLFGTEPHWTPVGFLPVDLYTKGAYFNGALYWVGTHFHQPQHPNLICSLDLDDYKLEQFSLPQLTLPERHTCHSYSFAVLNSAFYLSLCTGMIYGDTTFHVWQMEQDSSSWIKLFAFPKPLLYVNQLADGIFDLQLIKIYEDGKILCLYAGLRLILYDPATGTTQILPNQDQHLKIKKHFEVFPIDFFHFGSLHKILTGGA